MSLRLPPAKPFASEPEMDLEVMGDRMMRTRKRISMRVVATVGRWLCGAPSMHTTKSAQSVRESGAEKEDPDSEVEML